MEQITIVLNNMEDVTREINRCHRAAASSIVELGYILRKTDEAELYKEKGYSSIYKFAEQEYGWSQSQTSRFMDINREFSEGGYSTVLKEQYEGYGQAKLAEMLTLPEAVREELDPSMKREEIREIKREMNSASEEEKENAFVAAVMNESAGNDHLYGSIRQLIGLPNMGKRLPDIYPIMVQLASGELVNEEDIRLKLSGTGFGYMRAGAVMYFLKDENVQIVKGADKKAYSYREILEAVNSLCNPLGMTAAEWYRAVYARELPGTEKLEPAPMPDQERKTEKKPKVSAVEEKEPEPAQYIETSANSEERQELTGQSEIQDSAEEMTISYEKDEGQWDTIHPPVAPAHENTHGEEKENQAQYIETSANNEDQQEGCRYCAGKEVIQTNDGIFQIKFIKDGLVSIERGVNADLMKVNHCFICGKEFMTNEK